MCVVHDAYIRIPKVTVAAENVSKMIHFVRKNGVLEEKFEDLSGRIMYELNKVLLSMTSISCLTS